MIRNLIFLFGVRNLDLKKDNHGNCTTNRARESSLPRQLQTEIDTKLNSKSKKKKKNYQWTADTDLGPGLNKGR